MKIETRHNPPVHLELNDREDSLLVHFTPSGQKTLTVMRLDVVGVSPDRLILKLGIHWDHYVGEDGVIYFLQDENEPNEISFDFGHGKKLNLKRPANAD